MEVAKTVEVRTRRGRWADVTADDDGDEMHEALEQKGQRGQPALESVGIGDAAR